MQTKKKKNKNKNKETKFWEILCSIQKIVYTRNLILKDWLYHVEKLIFNCSNSHWLQLFICIIYLCFYKYLRINTYLQYLFSVYIQTFWYIGSSIFDISKIWLTCPLPNNANKYIRVLQKCTKDDGDYWVGYLLLTWVSGALTWDNMPGMLTLFLWRYFKKTSALRRANVHACIVHETTDVINRFNSNVLLTTKILRIFARNKWFGMFFCFFFSYIQTEITLIPWGRLLSVPDVCWSWEWHGPSHCLGPVYQRHHTSLLLSCTPAPGFLIRCTPETHR